MKLQDLGASLHQSEAWLMLERRQRAADWHGEQAAKAYRRKDMGAYVRHAQIADRLWRVN